MGNTWGNKNSRSHKPRHHTRSITSIMELHKKCKQCQTSIKYDHCCYKTCFETIFNAHSFIDVLETTWIFTNKHEIELYNILLPLNLECIIPLIGGFLPHRKTHHVQMAQTPEPTTTKLPFPSLRHERAVSVPFYVPCIDVSSSSYNTSSAISVHAFFHGYISLYRRDCPPCFTWLSTLHFDEYDDRNHGKKKKIQITVLGDVGVGKSTLIHRYLNDEFTDNYTPTIFDCYTYTIPLCDTECDIDKSGAIEYDFDPNKIEQNISDTAGGDVMAMAGSIDEWIQNGQVFLLCFDVTRGMTLHYLKSYIIPRIQQHFEQGSKLGSAAYTMDESSHIGPCAIVLVGCKVDLRGTLNNINSGYKTNMNNEMMKNYDSAMQLAREMNCPYIETSAKSPRNVEFLFKQCVYEYWIQTQTNCIKWKR